MGMFDFFKKKPPAKKKAIAGVAEQQTKSAKDLATEKGEPYIEILTMELDPNNLNYGSFELDWNDKFVADLVRHGYMMSPQDTDAEIVDRWFTNVCRNIVLETYEQEQAMNPQRVVKSRDIGDGRSEVS